MGFNVQVMPKANAKLEAHVNFLARVSEPAAVRLYDAYNESLHDLEENPHMYPSYVSEVDTDLKYKLFSNRYRIVFEIAGNNVFIYDIQDCRQDIDKNLL